MKRWIAFATVFALGLAALIYCQIRRVQTPVSPAPILYFIADSEHELTRLPVSFTHLSDSDEIKIGNQLAREYETAWPKPWKESAEDRAIRLYVERIGARVAARAHRKLPYKFHYIPDMDYFNAFALPGGHVYIGAGLISVMDSEDELAAVLGHEVEHIDHYHCAERVQTEMALRRIPLGELIAIPVAVFEAGYSKDQELEADREGTRLAVWAGYSPLGAIHMFEAFQRLQQERSGRALSPQQELSRVAWQTLEGYFRSHPLPSERIAQIKQMISEENWTNLPAERNLEVEYVFLTRRAKRAIEAKRFQDAARLAAQSLGLKPDQPEALAALAEAKFALGNYAGAAAAYRQAQSLSPEDASSITNFAATLAIAELGDHDYGEAVKLAEETLKLNAADPGALGALGDAQFALANFNDAAAAYRKLLDISPDNLARVMNYATALSAESAPLRAAAEFNSWFISPRSPSIALAVGARIEQAGLDLMAGNSAPLDQMMSQARAGGVSELNANSLARLGWWCYRAGKLATAGDLLNSAVQAGGARFGALDTLGWVLIEQGEPKKAQELFTDTMGKAVAWWQTHAVEEALKDFGSACDAKPEWLNPKWVTALYWARVEQSIAEMQAERARRLKAGSPAPTAH